MSETTSYSLTKTNAQLMILNDEVDGCHLFPQDCYTFSQDVTYSLWAI